MQKPTEKPLKCSGICFALQDRKANNLVIMVIMHIITQTLKSIGYTKLEIPHTAGQFGDTHCTAAYIFK